MSKNFDDLPHIFELHVGTGKIKVMDHDSLSVLRLRARELFAALDVDGSNLVSRKEFMDDNK